MRLISKQHDYYDIAIMGMDPTLCFVRTNKVISYKRDLKYNYSAYLFERNKIILKDKITVRFVTGFVGFCGEMYPYICFTTLDYLDVPDKPIYAYSIDDIKKHFPDIFEGNAKVIKYSGIGTHYFTEYFQRKQKPEQILKTCMKHNCAYFHDNVAEEQLEIYPLLRELQFYRVFDPYTCYQKIEMFLTNQLAPRDTMKILPIPDSLKAESHGFNKYSFRKDKQK